jgi:hypothetical protein
LALVKYVLYLNELDNRLEVCMRVSMTSKLGRKEEKQYLGLELRYPRER